MPDPVDETENTRLFHFFNEIGILHQLSRALLEDRLPNGLLMPHFTVLNHLMRVRDGRTPLELARAFQVPKTSLTHTLAGLEAQGLVEMRPNPDDGRSKMVWITAEGRNLRDRMVRELTPELAAILDQAGGVDIATLTTGLERVREVMDALRG